jgi:ribA/ribD-fused uncharacterized protein
MIKLLKKILETDDPKAVRKLGRLVKGFDECVWKNNREEIVIMGNLLKFRQNPKLLKKLLTTTGTLVEASPYDRVWGIGLGASNPKSRNKNTNGC